MWQYYLEFKDTPSVLPLTTVKANWDRLALERPHQPVYIHHANWRSALSGTVKAAAADVSMALRRRGLVAVRAASRA